jgi:hypothetical protein
MCVCERERESVCVCVCVCVCLCTSLSLFLSLCMYVCLYYTYVCMCTHTHTLTHSLTRTLGRSDAQLLSPARPPNSLARLPTHALPLSPLLPRPRDSTVSLRPHPAAGDLYVWFAEGGGGREDGSQTQVTLTLQDGSGEKAEVLTIVVNASWL